MTEMGELLNKTCPRSLGKEFLKLQSVTFGALAVNKQNCVHLTEEHCSRSYFSLFMSMTNHTDTGLLQVGITADRRSPK